MPRENLNWLRTRKSRFELVADMVEGREADLVLENAKIVNVYTREILDGGLAVFGDRIGFIGDTSEVPARQRIDVRGNYLTPGLMDGHLHIDSCMLNVRNFARGVLPYGTTAVVIDSHEIGNALGTEGVRMMIEEGKRTPLRLFQYVPSQVPTGNPDMQTPNEIIGLAETKELYALENFIGLGEVSKYKAIGRNPEMVSKIEWILSQGGVIEGNAHDFTGRQMQAYTATGIYADHEAVDEVFALERARLGLTVMMREGTTEKDLARCVKAVTEHGADPSHFCFCSDDRHPSDIVAEGHVNFMISLAIREGVDPLVAVQMATINCARNFAADREIGGLAPGKVADILVVEDLRDFNPRMVFVGGQLVAENGELTVPLPEFEYPATFLKSFHLPREVVPGDMVISAEGRSGEVPVWVIDAQVGRIWSGKGVGTVAARNDELLVDTDQDILKVVVVERYGGTAGPNIGKAFLRGFGLKSGAIAQSIAQDKHDIVAAGADDRDLAIAINQVASMNGGLVVANHGEVLGTLGLPIGGLMANKSIEEVDAAVRHLADLARTEMGCIIRDPFACLQFQTHPVIPFLKVSDKGLMDTREQRLLNLIRE
jgi:adenine deaminase